MATPTKLPQTACLMRGMAEKLGVTPGLARVSSDQLEKMAATCRICTRADDCILWIVDHASGAASAPSYCLNAEILETLRLKEPA